MTLRQFLKAAPIEADYRVAAFEGQLTWVVSKNDVLDCEVLKIKLIKGEMWIIVDDTPPWDP